MICDDRTLWKQHSDIIAALREIRGSDLPGNRIRAEFIAHERWLPYLKACWDDAACLSRRQQARLADLAPLQRAARGEPMVRLDLQVTPNLSTGTMATPQGGTPDDIRIVVEPDGTILRLKPDNSGEWSNPALGTRGSIWPDGTRVQIAPMEIDASEPPPLPGQNSAWTVYLVDKAEEVALNVLSQEQLDYLVDTAPSTDLARLDFTLDFLAFITGGNF